MWIMLSSWLNMSYPFGHILLLDSYPSLEALRDLYHIVQREEVPAQCLQWETEVGPGQPR